MPPKTLSLYALTLLALTTGCDLFGPAPSLSHAAATNGCGPADGPTWIILLAPDPIRSATPPTPYVSVEIWQPVIPVLVQAYAIGSGASASYSPWPGTVQRASGGSVALTKVDSAGIEGTVDLRFPAKTVKTAFSGPWIRSSSLCN